MTVRENIECRDKAENRPRAVFCLCFSNFDLSVGTLGMRCLRRVAFLKKSSAKNFTKDSRKIAILQ